MKVHCPITGLSYEVFSEVEDLHASAPHPVLYSACKVLNASFLPTFAAQSLSSENTHLLGMAYLLKLPIVSVPSLESDAHQKLHTFWLTHMEKLAQLATTLEGKELGKHYPRVRVSTDNLANLKHWLEDLDVMWKSRSTPISEAAKKLNSQSHISIQISPTRNTDAQKEIEALILKGLRGSMLTRKETAKFPEVITKWVMNVAPFPTAKLTLLDGKKTTISEHWQHMMELAFSKDGALDLLCENVTPGDLEELLEHCYENIPVEIGTMASLLWKKLEAVKAELEEFKASGTLPTKTAKTPKIPSFKGTNEELLALLIDDEKEVTFTKPATDTGLSLKEKLALKLKK